MSYFLSNAVLAHFRRILFHSFSLPHFPFLKCIPSFRPQEALDESRPPFGASMNLRNGCSVAALIKARSGNKIVPSQAGI